MRSLISGRDFIKIQDAAEILGVSEQTLRNWDRSGKLKAHRHPMNGYRLYRVPELHALLKEIDHSPHRGDGLTHHQAQLTLLPNSGTDNEDGEDLPPCHWSPEVALDPKHRPQRWDAPSTTVRRDWRKYPQEAYVVDSEGRRYRRLTVDEIALLQGLDPRVFANNQFTNRQKIAAIGDAVPPPLANAILQAIDERWSWTNKTAAEICAGVGGLAEGAAAIGLSHLTLVDNSEVCGALLRNDRPWPQDAVAELDVQQFDWASLRGRVGLLSGGPPCQPWSQAGHRDGAYDKRDLLSFIPSVIRDVEPEVFLIENVPGLATYEEGRYLHQVVASLQRPSAGMAYGVLVGILNAADFGVPQVRHRLFILGMRDSLGAEVHRCFDTVVRNASHRDPRLPNKNLPNWITVGETVEKLPDPGGWRRWIGADL